MQKSKTPTILNVSSCDFVDRSSVGPYRRSTKSHELTRTKNSSFDTAMSTGLPLHERNPRPVLSSDAVGETAEVVTRQVVLEVSWVEMIG